MNKKRNIRLIEKKELDQILSDYGAKPFVAKQILDWIWKKNIGEISQMRNLPKTLLDKLSSDFTTHKVKVKTLQKSADKTIKAALELYDGALVESVLIPTPKRITACVSSQVGCSLTCSFCATGKLKRMRNLTFDEIYDQVYFIKTLAEKEYQKPLSNIVYMGMGEPLLNYQNTLQSIHYITSEQGLGMSPSRITVSTAGIAKMIKKLGDDQVKFNLALSLHAAIDSKRDQIMPINASNNLEALSQAIQYYYSKTQHRMFYEYIIFKDFNDSTQDAAQLANFAKITPCKINIIEYNPIDDSDQFQKSPVEKVEAFKNYLESKNLIVNVRRSRGKDIDAACGQLANKNLKK